MIPLLRPARWLASLAVLGMFCSKLQGEPPAAAEPPVPKAVAVAPVASSMSVLDGTRILRDGDRLSFRVIEDGDPNVPLAVTDSGEMEVPYIGRVQAAGRTCKALATEIKGKLEKTYYIQATVLIGLDQAAPARSPGRVYLVGNVVQQGAQDMPPDEVYTVSKAILKAGGFTDFANKRKVKLVRRGNKGGGETVIVDAVEILQNGHTEKDLAVHPDDLIIIPQRLFNY